MSKRGMGHRFLPVGVLLALTISWGDTILPDTGDTRVIVPKNYLTNARDFPEIVVLGCVGYTGTACYKIETSDALLASPRYFSPFYLMVIKRELLEASGRVEATSYIDGLHEEQPIVFENLIHGQAAFRFPISGANMVVEKRSLVVSDDRYYAITETTDENLTLKLVKRLIGYTGGIPDKVIRY